MTSKQRIVEDRLFKGLTSYIETLAGVEEKGVSLALPPPLSPIQISEWEARNQAILPFDFKNFLLTSSDGVSLKWVSSLYSCDDSLGCIEILPLNEICRSRNQCDGANFLDAFKIQSCEPFGDVFMTIPSTSPSSSPDESIYFRDKESDEWIFITHSFANYFRLMVACLGIKGWQLAYKLQKGPLVGNGWSQWTRNWIYFYAKDAAKIIAGQIKDQNKPMQLQIMHRDSGISMSRQSLESSTTYNSKSTKRQSMPACHSKPTADQTKPTARLNMDRVIRTAQLWKEQYGGGEAGGDKLTVELIMQQIQSSRKG